MSADRMDYKGHFLRVNKLSKILRRLVQVMCKNERVLHLPQSKFLSIPENAATLLQGNTSYNHTFPLQINF